MAKLYFNYSTMNAGKSTLLLEVAARAAKRGQLKIPGYAGDGCSPSTGQTRSDIPIWERLGRLRSLACAFWQASKSDLRQDGHCSVSAMKTTHCSLTAMPSDADSAAIADGPSVSGPQGGPSL